jgi:hypothetical protein
MDPYLEYPGLWPDVHHNLITNSRALLSAELRPKYVVRIEERTYIADEPDTAFNPRLRVSDVEGAGRPGSGVARFSFTLFEEEIHEAFLKIIDRESRDVVTVIEILSPTNKLPGTRGRESFEQNRRDVVYSPSHWVEIDLLRGTRMVHVPKEIASHEYVVHVSKKDLRPRGLLYPIRLTQRLPIIPIPLKPEDPDARLDLQTVLDAAYDRAGYDLEIDYRSEPRPPLDGELASWADQLLRSKGLR